MEFAPVSCRVTLLKAGFARVLAFTLGSNTGRPSASVPIGLMRLLLCSQSRLRPAVLTKPTVRASLVVSWRDTCRLKFQWQAFLRFGVTVVTSCGNVGAV